MKFTLDTQFGTLLDNPQAKTIIEKYLPGVANNPMVALAKGMSLKALLATPQAKQFGITSDKVQSVLDEINKIVG